MIRGELVNLRAVERFDAETLHRWFNDPDIMRYWGVPDPAVSRSEVERKIESWLEDERRLDRPSCFMIELLDHTEIGVAMVNQQEAVHASAELSLLIGERDRWGEGLGKDALTTLVDVCFDQWNLHRLSLRVEAFNERAQRLYERCGFVREATFHDASYFDGAYHDVLGYSLLATDRELQQESSP